jgi:hypothetical protein
MQTQPRTTSLLFAFLLLAWLPLACNRYEPAPREPEPWNQSQTGRTLHVGIHPATDALIPLDSIKIDAQAYTITHTQPMHGDIMPQGKELIFMYRAFQVNWQTDSCTFTFRAQGKELPIHIRFTNLDYSQPDTKDPNRVTSLL